MFSLSLMCIISSLIDANNTNASANEHSGRVSTEFLKAGLKSKEADDDGGGEAADHRLVLIGFHLLRQFNPPGDSKESFYVGPLDDPTLSNLNQWASEDILPSWRPAVESYYRKVMSAGKRLISPIAPWL
ncbi:hypothetical protein ACFX2J_031864 [Malus domestica]